MATNVDTIGEDGEGEGRTQINPDNLEWEHDYERSPYANLVALVRELSETVPKREIVRFAFKRIAGLGPHREGKAGVHCPVEKARSDDRPLPSNHEATCVAEKNWCVGPNGMGSHCFECWQREKETDGEVADSGGSDP